jgi:hypothetical protein
MKRLIALFGALALTMAMAAPAAADQKVLIPPPYSDKGSFKVMVSDTNPEWTEWNDWACTDPIWYYAEWDSKLWFWYPNSVDTSNPDEYMPMGEAWPWKRGMGKNKGLDVFASNEDLSGKVLRSTLRLTDRLYDHKVNGNVETWKVKTSGKDWNLTAPGVGPVFKSVGNWRGTATFILPDGPFSFSDFVAHGPEDFYDTDALCEYFGADPAIYW